MSDAGLVGNAPITLVTGPEEYLFGEEKALLEVIEGEDPLPRLFPPYIYGLFTAMPQMGWSAGVDLSSDGLAVPSSNPTLVNNVETLANVVPILGRGADWYRTMGTAQSPGVAIATVVGDVQHAGVAELELGEPLGSVIERVAGGPRRGRAIKAVLSGVASGVIPARALDVPVSYEGLAAIDSGLGSLGFIVYDDTADMVAVARAVSRFLYVESCGQCPACKFGTGEVTSYLDHIATGDAVGTDSATFTISSLAAGDAGTYSVIVSNGCSSNVASTNNLVLTVNKIDATWTTNAANKIYGDANPSPLTTGSGSGFIVADGVSATYSRAAGETVAGGPYLITATLGPAGVLSNYTITNTGGNFTISGAVLSELISVQKRGNPKIMHNPTTTT